MFKFIKDTLSGEDGRPSSKRMVMFLLTFLFIGITLYDMLYGKKPDDIIQNQLFYLLCWIFATVFGEKVTGMVSGLIKPPKNVNQITDDDNGGDHPPTPPKVP